MSQCRNGSSIWCALLIAAVLLFSVGYFPDLVGGANQDSRFGLTRSIVERHRLYIDGYERGSVDRASWNGHFYSDKAPGLALSAAPIWESGRRVLRVIHREPSGLHSLWAERYLATIVCVGLPSALAAAFVFLIALKFGASLDGAAFAALTLGLATPFWCYATLFWGHAASASYLVFAFAAAVALREYESPWQELWLGICVGLAAGWATVTEFPAAFPAAILASLALANGWTGGSKRLHRVAAGIAIGALPCVAVLMTFNALAFGSPVKLGYALSAQQGWPLMQQGIMGVTYPKMWVLREVLLGRYRGLLPLAPVLAAAPIGWWLLWKQRGARGATIAVTAIGCYYLLFNASYALWDGGYAFGPRFLSPALPFLCLPLAFLWTRASRPLRWLLGALTCYGGFISLVAVSTDPMPPTSVKSPVWELLWPAFHTGQLSWNLGMLTGSRGLWSLTPLLAVWAIALATWMRLSAEPKLSEIGRVARGEADAAAPVFQDVTIS